MQLAVHGAEKILCALSRFVYLTAEQLTRLLYQPSSLSFVRKKLKALRTAELVLALPGASVAMPRVYTPTSAGYTAAAALGAGHETRIRPSAERDKARNVLFLEHTIAISGVLIAAALVAKTHPLIELSRLYTERSLKRKIVVKLAENRTHYIEPDAACEFRITEIGRQRPQTWQDFFNMEVYRHLPLEGRFKQKVTGYVASVDTGMHEALFKTKALSIAVFCATRYQAETLRKWTEEALTAMGRVEEGERFFFRSVDVSKASPEELFLSSVWERACSDMKTPLLVLE